MESDMSPDEATPENSKTEAHRLPPIRVLPKDVQDYYQFC